MKPPLTSLLSFSASANKREVEMNEIYAIKHQINAARLRLSFFERLQAKGIKHFYAHDVDQEVKSMKAKLTALEGE